MKRVSAKLFFTVVWRGLCQSVAWLFGLFGYKRGGKFAQFVWELFATSAAVIMFLFAVAAIFAAGEEVCDWYDRHFKSSTDPDCYSRTYVGQDICFQSKAGGKGYVYNYRSGEKYLKHVAWIAEPEGEDSLVCFSNGKKCGFFSKNTGKVVIEPQFSHAGAFSEGLACVEDGGFLKFIDATGNVVLDTQMESISDPQCYVFRGGYCVVDAGDMDHRGLMDKQGNIVLPMEYRSIRLCDEYDLWQITKGDETGLLDKDMKTILPLTECSIYIDQGTIDVTLKDHTMRKYDLDGRLIHDFYISGLRMLEYETEEIAYQEYTSDLVHDGVFEEIKTACHPKATACLRAYVAGDGFEGLMTADGHVVTMPLYTDIEAIADNLYLCTSTNYDKVIVDGMGQIVR